MLLSATWEHRMRVIHWVEGIEAILTHRLQGLSAAEMIEASLLTLTLTLTLAEHSAVPHRRPTQLQQQLVPGTLNANPNP